MKKLHASHVIVILTVILIVAVTAVAFHKGKNEEKPKTDWTQYYWFDASGNYLWRQNTIDYEVQLTGFNEAQTPPFTLMEKGYTPSTVSGFPPTPNLPWLPAKRLYTHP
jgi:hypothetical protein